MATFNADARKWLRRDAAYCAGTGVVMVAGADQLGRLFHVPAGLVAAAGAVTALWALLLLRFASRADWRPQVRRVAVANLIAAVTVALLAAAAPALAARLLLVAVAIEVAAFAVVQVRLLARAG